MVGGNRLAKENEVVMKNGSGGVEA